MPGPLTSLKILDFTTLLPGPFGTMMLADMGAEVLRVEAPNRADLMRALPPRDGDDSVAHRSLARSKESICVNLKKEDGARIVKDLIKDYDILVEGFRPGVMARFGLGYEDLVSIKEDLIYVSLTGYGQDGPLKDRAGHDINYQALSGLAHYNGRREHGPVPSGFQVADIAGGSCHLVMGLLAAVIYRKETGKGQFLDVSMTDAAFALNNIHGAMGLKGASPGLESTSLNGGGFYDYYRTKDGRYMSVGSLEPAFLKTLLATLERQELFAKAYSQNPGDQAQVKKELSRTFMQKNQSEWISIFALVDCCVEPVLAFEEAADHSYIKAREMVVDVPKEDGGALRQIAFPIKFSKTKPSYKYAAKKQGEDTQKVLARLGYESEKIKDLARDGVIL